MNTKKLSYLLLLTALILCFSVKAQVTIGAGVDPNPSAVLDLISNNKFGLLLPRVALQSTASFAPLGTLHVAGMLVYNTATTGDITPGIYYNDGGKWMRALNVPIDLTSASNGVTENGNDVELGGNLTKSTVINQATYPLTYSGTGAYSVNTTGNITLGTGASKASVGIAPTTTSAKFEVNGTSANTKAYNAQSSTTIDFSQSNLAYTTASAGAFTLQNLKDGATYTLAVRGTNSGTSSFTATNTAGGNVTIKIINNRATIASKETLYTIIVMGTTGYVYIATGF